jgi:hypothetical protein
MPDDVRHDVRLLREQRGLPRRPGLPERGGLLLTRSKSHSHAARMWGNLHGVKRRTIAPMAWLRVAHAASVAAATVLVGGCSLAYSLDGLTGGKSGPGGDDDSGLNADADDMQPSCTPPTDDYGAAVYADGPIAYWRLDDAPPKGSTANTLAHDSSVGCQHDALYAGNVYSTSGPISGHSGAYFDGNSYVDAMSSLSFDGQSTFSIEAWVKPADVNVYAGIVSCNDGKPPDEGYLMFLVPVSDAGASGFGFQRIDGMNVGSVATTSSVSTSSFTYVVATYDGANIYVYVNAGSPAYKGDVTFSLAGATNNLVIGAEEGGQANLFEGSIAEVAIYATNLSQSQISSHYKAR